MKRLVKLFSLAPAERRLLFKVVLLLGTVRLGLWLLPFETLRDWLVRLDRRPGRPRPPLPEQIVWAVETAAPYVPRATCLTRALAAKVMLAWAHCPSHLHIGVAKNNGHFQAHAWLECQGKVIIGGHESGLYNTLSVL
jgi:hypothetical protein